MNATILLTIDVEDWFQVENLRPNFPPSTWDRQQLRVEQNTHNILDLLDSIKLQPNLTNSVYPKATFFTLSWIAKRCPHLIHEIVNRGHEVASHGHRHLMCNQLTTTDLKQDLARSKKIIEDISGVQVKGYRAPNFSITDNALSLIQATGYQYDSSYNNFSKHGRYGTISLNGNQNSGKATIIKENFMELPISNLRIGKHIIPWGGGGYFRLFPPLFFRMGVKRILRQSNIYTFYIHPWEIDPYQPRINNTKRLSGWRHYLNLKKTYLRLHSLITEFSHCKFMTCSQYLNEIS